MGYTEQELADRLLNLLRDRSVIQGYSRMGGRSGATVTVSTDNGALQATAVGAFPPGECLAVRDPDTQEWLAYSAHAAQVTRSQTYRRSTRIEPATQTGFNFYVGFSGFLTKAKDTSGRSLPIKSFLNNTALYEGVEAGFVSTKDGFIYSVGNNDKAIYKINSRTLESALVFTIDDPSVNVFFTALCLGPDDTLFGAFLGNLYKRSPDGTEVVYSLNTQGTDWSIATLDNRFIYLVTDYYSVFKFDCLTNELTTLRPDPSPGISESTFLFTDDKHQSIYLFGLLDTSARGQSVFWRIRNDAFEEYYRFPLDNADGTKQRFYGFPSRSTIIDSKTRTLFMIGVDIKYESNGIITLEAIDKIIRLDRNKKRTDFTLRFDATELENEFTFFGQLDWIY